MSQSLRASLPTKISRNARRGPAKVKYQDHYNRGKWARAGWGVPSSNHRDQASGLLVRWATASTLASFAKWTVISAAVETQPSLWRMSYYCHPLELSRVFQNGTCMRLCGGSWENCKHSDIDLSAWVVTAKQQPHGQAFGSGVRSGLPIAASWELLFWGHRAWERLIALSWLLCLCHKSSFSLAYQTLSARETALTSEMVHSKPNYEWPWSEKTDLQFPKCQDLMM